MTDILTNLAALTATHENGLLPCPHCSGRAQMNRTGFKPQQITYMVGCEECGFRGQGWVVDKDKAKDFWNTRPRESALIALVQEAAAEIERFRPVLEAAKARLEIYRASHSGEYVGGMEYAALLRLIGQAFNPKEAAP